MHGLYICCTSNNWAAIFILWINFIYTKRDWTKVVQDKANLSSGKLLNNHIYPVDNWIDDLSSG
jgi:hypothetical protein